MSRQAAAIIVPKVYGPQSKSFITTKANCVKLRKKTKSNNFLFSYPCSQAFALLFTSLRIAMPSINKVTISAIYMSTIPTLNNRRAFVKSL